MTTIAIVANCQSKGLAEAIAALLPSAEVEAFNVSLFATSVDRQRALDEIGRKDLAFVMPFRTDEHWSSVEIAAVSPWPVYLPALIFQGFHPDTTYIPAELRGSPSPIGDYHSIIAVAGYVSGRSVTETIRLFNPLVYARLGFFDSYDREYASVETTFAAYGLAIGPLLKRWSAQGCFMHSMNHPKPYVIHDLARAALRHAGIAPDDDGGLDDLPDTLAIHSRMPVYPEIAARLGFAGSTTFEVPSASSRSAASIELPQFVAGSFASYATLRRAELAAAIGVRRALTLLS